MTQSLKTISAPLSVDVNRLNQQFSNAHPKSVLLWCLENMSEGMVQTTAFGTSGMVILDLLYGDLNPDVAVPVIFLDTLHHFAETHRLVARAQERYDLDLKIYRPQGAQSRSEFARVHGDHLWEADINRFHTLTKVEPLQRAFSRLDVQSWITGRRRDQSTTRVHLPIFEQDANGRIKINPLAGWTNRDVWKYIVDNQVPYNSLHDQGYGSIGDEPLTTPLMTGEHERDGRWRGLAKTECGIHV
ncbi:MAG: phosphoadenosine phosphosulfate reductase [Cyanobacteria bacterium P01_F01_bin.42]